MSYFANYFNQNFLKILNTSFIYTNLLRIRPVIMITVTLIGGPFFFGFAGSFSNNQNLGNLCQDVTPASNPDPLLWSAAQTGDLQSVQEAIICHKANINSTDALGRSALHLAAELGNISIINFLIQNGIDAGIKNNEGLTAGDIAVQSNNQMAAQLLMQSGSGFMANQPELPNDANTLIDNNQRGTAIDNRTIDNRTIITGTDFGPGGPAGLPALPPPFPGPGSLPFATTGDPFLDPTEQRQDALRQTIESGPFTNDLSRPADQERAQDIANLLPTPGFIPVNRAKPPINMALVPTDRTILP